MFWISSFILGFRLPECALGVREFITDYDIILCVEDSCLYFDCHDLREKICEKFSNHAALYARTELSLFSECRMTQINCILFCYETCKRAVLFLKVLVIDMETS